MEILLPFLLVILASFFQGSFGLGMKYMEPLKWEAWWIVHVTVAMIIFPILWAVFAVPNLFLVISNAPTEAVFLGMLFGFLWGVGGILFGKSVPYIGLSLTYGVVVGLAASVGSIIPLMQVEDAFSNPATTYVIIAVVIMFAPTCTETQFDAHVPFFCLCIATILAHFRDHLAHPKACDSWTHVFTHALTHSHTLTHARACERLIDSGSEKVQQIYIIGQKRLCSVIWPPRPERPRRRRRFFFRFCTSKLKNTANNRTERSTVTAPID